MSVLFIPAVVPKFHDHEMMSKLLGVVNDSSINGVDNPSLKKEEENYDKNSIKKVLIKIRTSFFVIHLYFQGLSLD